LFSEHAGQALCSHLSTLPLTILFFLNDPGYSDDDLVGVTTSSENSDYVLLFKTWLGCLQTVVALSINVLIANFLCASSWRECEYESICVGGFHADGMLHRVPQSVKP